MLEILCIKNARTLKSTFDLRWALGTIGPDFSLVMSYQLFVTQLAISWPKKLSMSDTYELCVLCKLPIQSASIFSCIYE